MKRQQPRKNRYEKFTPPHGRYPLPAGKHQIVRRTRKKKSHWTGFVLVFTILLLIATITLAFNPSILGRSDPDAGSAGSTSAPAGSDATPPDNESSAGSSEPALPATQPETEPIVEEKEIQLVAVGDVLLHMPLINGVKRTENGETVYRFAPVFHLIESIVQQADYATFNFEGTLAGPPYSGYPMFSAPDSIVPALKEAGFDLASTINNHSIDRGLDGLIRTAQVFLDHDFPVVGTRPDNRQESFTIEDINGISIGFASYSFETIGTENGKALNGITVPAGALDLIDSFNPYREARFQNDIDRIIERVELMRERGADFICLNLHWGDEYRTRSNPYQQEMAQRLADADVDLVIGHHPHVVQEIDLVSSTHSDHQMLVYYSLGNFVSNQYYDTGNAAGKGQDGIMARVTIRQDASGTRIRLGEYIPIHVVRVTADGIPSHRVVPVLAAIEDPQAYETTAAMMQSSLDRTSSILADSTGNKDIPIRPAGR